MISFHVRIHVCQRKHKEMTLVKDSILSGSVQLLLSIEWGMRHLWLHYIVGYSIVSKEGHSGCVPYGWCFLFWRVHLNLQRKQEGYHAIRRQYCCAAVCMSASCTFTFLCVRIEELTLHSFPLIVCFLTWQQAMRKRVCQTRRASETL